MLARNRIRIAASCFALSAATAWLGLADSSGLRARAQDAKGYVIQGYVTAVHPPAGFEVNGTPLTTTAETRYGHFGDKSPSVQRAMPDELAIGAFVRVTEVPDDSGKGMTAKIVLLRDDGDKRLSGYGVIEEVNSVGPDRVFQADGYRIHVTPSTAVEFRGGVKSVSDATPNTWIRYEGRRDKNGELNATKATFSAVKLGHLKPRKDQTPQIASPPKGSIIDADGKLVSDKTKVRLSEAGGWCGWHRVTDDAALQERVQRVGRRLVPAYQNALPDSSRAKIPFRFYVVEDDRIRADLSCNDGLVLIPKRVIERLKTEDQLAAVIADGIPFALQVQGGMLVKANYLALTIGSAEDAAEIADPWLVFAAEPLNAFISHEVAVREGEQRGRMALAMMAVAGYDPWQAPEAWRLLAPRHEAADPTALRYPSRGAYQLDILYLQYGKKAAKEAAPLSSQDDSAAAAPGLQER